MEFRQILEFIRENLWRCALGAVGLISAILLLTIGFVNTLIIVAVTAACCVIGYFIDKHKNIDLGEHKWLIVLGALGLVLAILMLTVGFFKTLLIAVLMGVFGGFGFLVDKAGFKGAISLIIGFFKRRNN